MNRVTKETNVSVKINLDGDAVAENNTGIPFLDHMLDVSFQCYFLYFVVGLSWLLIVPLLFKIELIVLYLKLECGIYLSCELVI